MLRKLAAAGEALAGRVARVQIADGRTERPLLEALAGAGTRIVPPPGDGASADGRPAEDGMSLAGDPCGGRA
jgi:hypothetical protein